MPVGPNDRCACGSGKESERCCQGKLDPDQQVERAPEDGRPVALHEMAARLLACAGDPQPLAGLLIATGEDLHPGLRQRLLDAGVSAAPAVVAILADPDLRPEDGPGDGWAPIHAARLLRELRSPESLPAMLRVFASTETLDLLSDELRRTITSYGVDALEPTLRAYAEAKGGEARETLASLLPELGVRDDRVLEILLKHLKSKPDLFAGCLAEYGDERAIDALKVAFDRARFSDRESWIANQDAVELKAAIEELGGELSLEQQQKYARAMSPREKSRAQLLEALSIRLEDP